ncbi:MAG: T9SS type A sorting domain-containing protein [Candidatus Kapaibacterium sp.]
MRKMTILAMVFLMATLANAQLIYEFRVSADENCRPFYAKTSDPEVIRQCREQIAKPVGERPLFINGTIDYGDGGYNEGWSWHFVPGEWHLTEMAIELCDGTPDLVEEDVEYWVETVGHYCPWTAYVVREIEPNQVEMPAPGEISAYPNPCEGSLTLRFPEAWSGECMLTDNIGREMASAKLNADMETELDVSHLSRGIYHLLISTGGENYHLKVIKK